MLESVYQSWIELDYQTFRWVFVICCVCVVGFIGFVLHHLWTLMAVTLFSKAHNVYAVRVYCVDDVAEGDIKVSNELMEKLGRRNFVHGVELKSLKNGSVYSFTKLTARNNCEGLAIFLNKVEFGAFKEQGVINSSDFKDGSVEAKACDSAKCEKINTETCCVGRFQFKRRHHYLIWNYIPSLITDSVRRGEFMIAIWFTAFGLILDKLIK